MQIYLTTYSLISNDKIGLILIFRHLNLVSETNLKDCMKHENWQSTEVISHTVTSFWNAFFVFFASNLQLKDTILLQYTFKQQYIFERDKTTTNISLTCDLVRTWAIAILIGYLVQILSWEKTFQLAYKLVIKRIAQFNINISLYWTSQYNTVQRAMCWYWTSSASCQVEKKFWSGWCST